MTTPPNEQDLVYRLRKRAEIRRQIATRKSVQEGKADRISDLLEEAADEIIRLKTLLNQNYGQIVTKQKSAQEWVDGLSEEQINSAYLKITDGWKALEPELWQEVMNNTIGLEPMEVGGGTHCWNEVFKIGSNLYDLTYEFGYEKPIDIKFKRAPE
jgi:hypothetical protein